MKTLYGHTNFVFCVNFNPRSNLLVSGGYDETVRVWDVARGESIGPHARCVYEVSSDRQVVEGITRPLGSRYSCGLQSRRHVDRLMCDGWFDVSLTVIGRRSCMLNWVTVEYGTQSQDSVSRRSSMMIIRYGSSSLQVAYPDYVDVVVLSSSHVKFSPNSRYILATTHDSTIRLWNFQTSRCVKTYKGHINRTYCVFTCFSTTQGHHVVSGSEDGKVYVWDVQSREVVQVLEGHRGGFNSGFPGMTSHTTTDVVLAVAVRISPVIPCARRGADLLRHRPILYTQF